MDIKMVVKEWLKRANQKALLSMSTKPLHSEDFMSRANERTNISTHLSEEIGPTITLYIDQEKELHKKSNIGRGCCKSGMEQINL